MKQTEIEKRFKRIEERLTLLEKKPEIKAKKISQKKEENEKKE